MSVVSFAAPATGATGADPEFRDALGPAWQGLPPGVQIDRDLVFKEAAGQALRLDVYRPEVKPSVGLPVIFWIGGGGWHRMGKNGALKHAAWLTAHGFVVVGLSYRVSPAVKYPVHLEDCWDAVKWVRDHAVRLGIDPQRVGLLGDSAGAHLSLLLATGQASAICSRGEELPIRAVVGLCPPTDLTRDDAIPRDLWDGFLGGWPGSRPELAKLASPLHQLTDAVANCRFLLVHGEADRVVSIDQSARFAVAARARGAAVELIRIPGVGHTNEFYHHRVVREQTRALFESALR